MMATPSGTDRLRAGWARNFLTASSAWIMGHAAIEQAPSNEAMRSNISIFNLTLFMGTSTVLPALVQEMDSPYRPPLPKSGGHHTVFAGLSGLSLPGQRNHSLSGAPGAGAGAVDGEVSSSNFIVTKPFCFILMGWAASPGGPTDMVNAAFWSTTTVMGTMS